MVSVKTAPPRWFAGISHFPIEFLTTEAALANQLAVLVGVCVASDFEDDKDEDDGCPSEAVDYSGGRGEVERAVGEGEGGEELVGYYCEGQGEGEEEGGGGGEDACHVGWAGCVVVHGVQEGEEDGEPGEKEEDGGGFEASVGSLGGGYLEGLVGGALKGDGRPVAWDGHEEVLGSGLVA